MQRIPVFDSQIIETSDAQLKTTAFLRMGDIGATADDLKDHLNKMIIDAAALK